MFGKIGEVGIEGFRKILDFWAAGRADSLIDYTRPTRVEPIVLIDSDAMYVESLQDILQSLLSIFAGYYLQAVAIRTNINNVSVARTLDSLNPSRSALDSAASASPDWIFAAEQFKHKLPSFSMESNDGATGSTFNPGRDTMREIKELSNLSVGKLFTVEISDGSRKAVIPVAIRLIASSMPSQSLAHILSVDNIDKSMKERWHGFLSGRLSFFKDLVLCQDLITAHRKALMADKDDVYSNILKRVRGNQLSSIVSMNPSVANASNMVIISDTTAAEIERDINGKLSDFRTRQKLFEKTYLMIMVVVDKQWERVSIYHNGIAMHNELSYKDLKSLNKGTGPDVSDILKAYTLGNSPTL